MKGSTRCGLIAAVFFILTVVFLVLSYGFSRWYVVSWSGYPNATILSTTAHYGVYKFCLDERSADGGFLHHCGTYYNEMRRANGERKTHYERFFHVAIAISLLLGFGVLAVLGSLGTVWVLARKKGISPEELAEKLKVCGCTVLLSMR